MAVLISQDAEDAYKNDYHGHPNYLMVFVALMVGLVVLFIPAFAPGVLTPGFVIVALLVAVVQAVLVASSFMHVKYEPKLLVGLLGFGLFCFLALFFAVYPDVSSLYDIDISKGSATAEYNTYTHKKSHSNEAQEGELGMVRGADVIKKAEFDKKSGHEHKHK